MTFLVFLLGFSVAMFVSCLLVMLGRRNKRMSFEEYNRIYCMAYNAGVDACSDVLSKCAETSGSKETLRHSELVKKLKMGAGPPA